MARELTNWINAFTNHCTHTESPPIMHFWAGVGAVAGALRRKVWIDMKAFRWSPNFFIIFVAPPGIVAKSTTADLSMDLLREVPGIKFGPDVVTWPALVSAFADAGESFQLGEEWIPMSPITLVASELGNLINPQDRDMINLYINLWDGRKKFDKVTKMSGNDAIEAPWINMLGCTTPHWIADNMPPATVGGGFTSRCVFVYTDQKEHLRAYPDEWVPADHDETKRKLIHDLEHIAVTMVGEYKLSDDARVWGRNWYEKLWDTRPDRLDDDKLDGYVARKQTHMHKLAIVLAACARDSLIITDEDLRLADYMLNITEKDLGKVFSRIGKSEDSMQVDRLIAYVAKHGAVPYENAYRMIHAQFPSFKDYEGIILGATRAGYIQMEQRGNEMYLVAVKDEAGENV